MVFNEVFLSDRTAIFMSLQVLFLWSLITISGMLAAISLSVYLHVPKYCSFFCFSDRCWFMFIPLARYLDVVYYYYYYYYYY